MELVKSRTEPLFRGVPASGLLTFIGDSKVGKSSFGASFPNSVLLSMEKKRTDRISYGRIQPISDLSEFGEALELCFEDDSVKTIILDTVDIYQGWIKESIAAEHGTATFGKPGPGVDTRAQWADYADRIRASVDFWKSSDTKLMVVLAHRRAATVDGDGRILKPAGTNVQGSSADYLIQQSEAVGFMGTRSVSGVAQHYLSFKATSETGVWRSGIDELSDKEVILSKSDPYGSFASLFKPQPERPATVLTPAKSTAGKRNK